MFRIFSDKAPISKEQAAKLEALRSRPKRRPDWNNMMKEIETGRKLNHVKCNDRSAPLLPRVKAKGQVSVATSEERKWKVIKDLKN